MTIQRYLSWALNQRRWRLWSFWIPMAATCVVSYALTRLLGL